MSESHETLTVGLTSFAAMAAELRKLHAEDYARPPAGAFTAAQYGAAVGVTQDAAACTLKRMENAGRVKSVGRFRITGGHMATFYQLNKRK